MLCRLLHTQKRFCFFCSNVCLFFLISYCDTLWTGASNICFGVRTPAHHHTTAKTHQLKRGSDYYVLVPTVFQRQSLTSVWCRGVGLTFPICSFVVYAVYYRLLWAFSVISDGWNGIQKKQTVLQNQCAVVRHYHYNYNSLACDNWLPCCLDELVYPIHKFPFSFASIYSCLLIAFFMHISHIESVYWSTLPCFRNRFARDTCSVFFVFVLLSPCKRICSLAFPPNVTILWEGREYGSCFVMVLVIRLQISQFNKT